MPKQIIGGVFEELLEAGKKTAGQVVKLPGEMVEEAAQQTGIKPAQGEQKSESGKVELEDMKRKDKESTEVKLEKLRKAYFGKYKDSFNQPRPALPHVEQEKQKEQMEMLELQEKKEKELPKPILIARKSKQARVEMKGKGSG